MAWDFGRVAETHCQSGGKHKGKQSKFACTALPKPKKQPPYFLDVDNHAQQQYEICPPSATLTVWQLAEGAPQGSVAAVAAPSLPVPSPCTIRADAADVGLGKVKGRPAHLPTYGEDRWAER